MDKKKRSVAILYIATGPYKKFWTLFYNSFQMNFCRNLEKKYYVFTDDINNRVFLESSNVILHKIDNMPWPLVTLLRFKYFNSICDELRNHDYILFSNANIECQAEVTESEIFGKEKLFFTQHPGYIEEKSKYFVLERNKKSKAYVPYRAKTNYVIGAFFGGGAYEFLEMSQVLEKNIEEDLKRNYIARWHDESHLNSYYYKKKREARLLSASYCYPFGFELPVERKIVAVDKQSVFDVNSFKGFVEEKKITKYQALKNLICPYLKKLICNFNYIVGA